jgi:hypothetical protein
VKHASAASVPGLRPTTAVVDDSGFPRSVRSVGLGHAVAVMNRPADVDTVTIPEPGVALSNAAMTTEQRDDTIVAIVNGGMSRCCHQQQGSSD